MARFVQPFTSPLSEQQVFEEFERFARNEGFEHHTEKGEPCLKKGKGVATGPQFLKLTKKPDGEFVLEAWIKYAIVPGVYVGEMGLDGFTGAIPKQMLKGRVDEFLKMIRAQVPVK